MNGANINPALKKFRFKTWSRKSYAAFNSLRIVVNIGKLAINICDRIGRKINSHLRRFELPNFSKKEAASPGAVGSTLESAIEMILLFFLNLCAVELNGDLSSPGKKNWFRSAEKIKSPPFTQFSYSSQFFNPASDLPEFHINTFINQFHFSYLINFCDHDK